MRTLLVCDRSAGHIFPALVLGKKLKDKQRDKSEIYFFATSRFLKKYLEDEGFIVLGRSFSGRNLFLETAWRVVEAVYLLFKTRPNRIIGFGGRDSFFLVFLGSLFFLDTAIYEPNIRLGKANRILSLFVKRIWYGFKENIEKESFSKKITFGSNYSGYFQWLGKFYIFLYHSKAAHIGIPLRENLRKINKTEALKILGFDNQPVIFCFGGSQGSSFINSIFIKLIENLKGDCQIIHLTGKREYFQIFQLYNKIKSRKFIRDFYYSMEVLYSAADVVVSRAGASTLGEIAYYGVPAVLIPHPAAGNHQRDNALYFKDRGAAFVFSQKEFPFREFEKAVDKLLYDNNLRESMKNHLSTIHLGVNFENFGENIYSLVRCKKSS